MELQRTGEKINNNSITRGTLFRHKEAFKTNLFLTLPETRKIGPSNFHDICRDLNIFIIQFCELKGYCWVY